MACFVCNLVCFKARKLIICQAVTSCWTQTRDVGFSMRTVQGMSSEMRGQILIKPTSSCNCTWACRSKRIKKKRKRSKSALVKSTCGPCTHYCPGLHQREEFPHVTIRKSLFCSLERSPEASATTERGVWPLIILLQEHLGC